MPSKRGCALCCAMLSAFGIIFLGILAYLIGSQPKYIKSLNKTTTSASVYEGGRRLQWQFFDEVFLATECNIIHCSYLVRFCFCCLRWRHDFWISQKQEIQEIGAPWWQCCKWDSLSSAGEPYAHRPYTWRAEHFSSLDCSLHRNGGSAGMSAVASPKRCLDRINQ